jgi:oxygen-independent coproporphyrinogen-3 oxidase
MPNLAQIAHNPPTYDRGIGLYLHVPFCQTKCPYCDFNTYAGIEDQIPAYVIALKDEIRGWGNVLSNPPVRTIFFGGGTPSYLPAGDIEDIQSTIRACFETEDLSEITMECNPGDVTPENATAWLGSGINRISMGVQSFDDELLKLNGRVHLGTDVERAFGRIRQAGFDHVNLDLMCGLIGETEEKWHESVRRVIGLGPESVTIYQTEIPLNTQLYRDLKSGVLPADPPSWETKRARLDYGFRELEAAGYSVVSAYNAVKDPDRHRFDYQDRLWRGEDMLGLGVAAFGYFDGVHFQNEVTLEKYEAAVEAGGIPAKRAYPLSTQDRVTREFILQLKLGGVLAGPFRDRYGVDILQTFEKPLRQLKLEGLLTLGIDGVRLTRAGLLRVDRLLPLFYDPQYLDVRYT